MHPITLLILATFIFVVGFLVWNKMSVDRHSFSKDKSGIGGSSDPLSGKGADVRPPDELRGALHEASVADAPAPDAVVRQDGSVR